MHQNTNTNIVQHFSKPYAKYFGDIVQIVFTFDNNSKYFYLVTLGPKSLIKHLTHRPLRFKIIHCCKLSEACTLHDKSRPKSLRMQIFRLIKFDIYFHLQHRTISLAAYCCGWDFRLFLIINVENVSLHCKTKSK